MMQPLSDILARLFAPEEVENHAKTLPYMPMPNLKSKHNFTHGVCVICAKFRTHFKHIMTS